MHCSLVYSTALCAAGRHHALAFHEAAPPPQSPKPRLLDRVREAIRLRHGSRSTEKAYVGWIRRYILFHGKRHPAEMGAAEVTRFLSSLAIDGRVAASTQNQALAALLFLYRHVLQQDLPWLDDSSERGVPDISPSCSLVTRSVPSSASSRGCRGSWRRCSTGPACACSNAAG
jgi:hypothetical protein